MPLFTTVELGDRLVLTDEQTGDTSIIDVEGPRKGKVRLKLDLPQHIQAKSIKLNSRIGSDLRVETESEPAERTPGPLGSTRVASAMQLESTADLDMRDKIGGEA